MCIWRDPESCDWLKCLLSIIYILWISNFDIVFGYIMKKLALAPDCLRGGCICKIIFPLFYLYTIFLFLSFNYKKEQRMTATLGLDKDPFTWKTTFIMSDFLFKWIFIYCSDLGIPNLYEMTACRPFYLIAVLHLNYLLCLYKLWTCHIHLTLPHISLFVFSFIVIFLFALQWAFTDCFWSSLKSKCVVWVENYICMLERGLRFFMEVGKCPGFFILLGERNEKMG